MLNNRIDVKAKIDTDFCKKGDIISMKEGVFNEYHKNNFEVVGAKKSTENEEIIEDEVVETTIEEKEEEIVEEKAIEEVKEEKLPTKENKAIKNAKNK